VDDVIPEVAARFIGRHKLSKTLLPNVEKELHVTQCELFRRNAVDLEDEIDELAARCEEAETLGSRKDARIRELETQLSKVHSEAEKHAAEAEHYQQQAEEQAREAAAAHAAVLEKRDKEEADQIELETAAVRRAFDVLAPFGMTDPGTTSLVTWIDLLVEHAESREGRMKELEGESEILRTSQQLSSEQLQNLKEKLAIVQAGLEDAKRGAENAEIRATEAHHAVIQEKNDHLARLQERIEELTKELEEKVFSLASTSQTARETEKALTELNKENQRLQETSLAAAAKSQRLEAQVGSITSENRQISAEKKQLETARQISEVTNQQLQAEVAEAASELRKLQGAIGAALTTASDTGERVVILDDFLKGCVDPADATGSEAETIIQMQAERDRAGSVLSATGSGNASLPAPSPPMGGGGHAPSSHAEYSAQHPENESTVLQSSQHESMASYGPSSRPRLSKPSDLVAPSQIMSLLQQAFELYSTTEHYNGQHLMSLTKFRKFSHECGLVDGRRVKPGDLDVVFHRMLTGHDHNTGLAQNDRMMSLTQFHDAVRNISAKIYATTIEQMTGKRMSLLTGAERDAALDASLEVFVQQHLAGFVEQKGRSGPPGLEETMQQHIADLNQAALLRQLELQLKPLSLVYAFYCESQRARSNPNPKVARGVGDKSLNECLSFKELTRMLTDFRIIPKLADASHVFTLWRHISSRDSNGAYNGIRFGSSAFSASIDGFSQKYSAGRTSSAVTALLALQPRPDFITFAQFVELLGHLALESMPHPTSKERIIALFQWLDQSEGNANMARIRGAAIVRFGVMTTGR